MTAPSPTTISRRLTVRHKNELHDLYRTNWERIKRRRLAPQDITPDFFKRREEFVKVMLSLYDGETASKRPRRALAG